MMFGTLKDYLDFSYWQVHPVLTLATPDGGVRGEIFAAYETTAGSESYTRSFDSEEAFPAFLDGIQGQSAYDTGITLSAEDRVLTLSTYGTPAMWSTPGSYPPRTHIHSRSATAGYRESHVPPMQRGTWLIRSRPGPAAGWCSG